MRSSPSADVQSRVLSSAAILITLAALSAGISLSPVGIPTTRGSVAAPRVQPVEQNELSLKSSVARVETAIPPLMTEGDVPGLTIALVQHGQLVWLQAFGVRNAKSGSPVEPGTLFQAASMSKPLFAMGVLKLVDEGKLDLDTPLAKYLPGPYIQGDDRINSITARMVLTHSTGFPNWRPDGGPLTIHFQPGSHFSYSGEGFVYLQKVVEHITGLGLNEYMKKSVMEPLGMTASSYVWEDRFNKYEPGLATGHNVAGVAEPEDHRTTANAAASLISTAVDYSKFVMALMEGTGLKSDTWRAMLTPQVKVNEGCISCLGSVQLKQSPSVCWGLGVGIQETALGPAFWHWGDNGDEGQCFMIGFEKQKAGIVIFTNSTNGQSIIPEILRLATGIALPSTAWLNYEAYNSPAHVLFHSIMTIGARALKEYVSHQDSTTKPDRLSEAQMNRLGYWLIAGGKVKEAIAVFEQNVADYPSSFNTYDSLGEAYMKDGQKELAVKNYKKSLELNPNNTNAVNTLKHLSDERR